MVVIVHKSPETLVRKGKNAGYQHFLLFPRDFQKVFLFFLQGWGMVKGKKGIHFCEISILWNGKEKYYTQF